MARQTRRGFLRSGLARGAFLGLGAGTYRTALGQDAPSERVRVACIGVGGQGKGNMNAVRRNVVAVCDVDRDHLATAAADLAKNNVTATTASDYRRLLDRRDVDAVLVSTPDHWHALPTIHACEAGKDVYCEKPLTLFVAEGRAIADAAKRHNRVVQTGSQQRSNRGFRQACELVRNGALGAIRTVKVGLPGPNFRGPAVPDAAPPAALDYQTWLGPAPDRPFNEKRVHYLFRFFWDYSGGQQTNFGAHDLDIAQWGLGMDASGPLSVEGTATFHKDGWFETPEKAMLTYTYPNNVTLQCSLGGGFPGGVTFEGARGSIHVNRSGLTVTLNGERVADPYSLPTGETRLYVSNNHHQNWLECVRSRRGPICEAEIGHRSATVCHLGNIALRTRRKITWDATKEQIVGDAAANAMLTRPYRAPYRLG
ncbi:MAG: Gfo/Idh/MocA family oxidoreductase [Gemmataceae bacterium]